jgi:hypothetical protein
VLVERGARFFADFRGFFVAPAARFVVRDERRDDFFQNGTIAGIQAGSERDGERG